MYPPIFTYAAGDTAVTNLLGLNPTRFWPFGQAPQDEQRPYAVHQLVYGSPENTLSCPPDTDLIGIQVDAYAKTVTDARAVSEALRGAFGTHGNIVSLNGELREPETGLDRVTFTVEFWSER